MPSSGEREELAAVMATAQMRKCLRAAGVDGDDIQDSLLQHWADNILSAGYRRAPGWRPITEANRETCAEILGVQFLGGRMMREPFISFWSPTLNKFYCDPTHFMLPPPSPEEEKA